MKTKFYTNSVFFLFLLFSQFSQAQQLLVGPFSGSVENLLGVRYRNVRNVNANQVQANFTGIPDLGSNRNSPLNSTRSDQTLNYGTSGTYSFTVTYDVALNTFTCVTNIGGINFTNVIPNVSGRLTDDSKIATAPTINYFGLTVRTQNSSSTIRVSNLVLEGTPITGAYERNNSNGESSWYTIASSLTNGFVLSGTVTLLGNFANSAESQRIQFFFGNTAASGGTLPIVWGGFTAKRTNSFTSALAWNTLQEQNASHFDIERSVDGIRFEKIGSILANGTTGTTTYYSFEDKNASGSLYYYRLAQYDLDGKKTFSSIQRIGNTSKETLVAKNNNNIVIQFFDNGNKQIRLVNMSGVILKQIRTQNLQLDISLTDLPNGIYIVQIINAESQKTETHKFVK